MKYGDEDSPKDSTTPSGGGTDSGSENPDKGTEGGGDGPSQLD